MRRSLILVSTLLATPALAGPLTPPAGPVAPTMKTLAEMDTRIPVNAQTTPGTAGGLLPSVYTISQPGSYYLTGPLAAQAGKVTIVIAASDVTLDLCGYTVFAGEGGIFAGDIANNAIVRGVCVRNGSVKGGASFGASLTGAHGSRLENMFAAAGAGTGLRVGTAGSMINCASVGNVRGFDVDSGSSVTACRAADNTEDGYLTSGAGATFTACTSINNGRWGFLCSASTLTDCTATGNGEHGIVVNGGSIVRGCHASFNDQDGFQCNGTGILERCVASQNARTGIAGFLGARVDGCTAQSNGFHGISVTTSCYVAGNTSEGNGLTQGSTGAGISITGAGSIVMDNKVFQNEFGIDTFPGATDNVIARNFARANSQGNFSIDAGNEFATVVTNPGSNGFSTATPWSNIAY